MLSLDPSEIDHWADLPGTSHQLPGLIRRLILATVPTPTLLDMPSGSSVWLSGWDGQITIPKGNPWAPAGASVWEISTEKNTKGKADRDYRKRTDDPQGVDTVNTTFVFVTPRRWSGKHDWITQRQKEKKWADVRALDASDLAAWLEQAPAVAEWFGRLIGKLPTLGYIPLVEWWERWSSVSAPNISPDLVIAGRGEAADALAQWAQQAAAFYYLKGYTRDEAIAFLAALAQSAPDGWGAALMAKAIVVENFDAWRSLERHSTPLVLIRNFDAEVAPQIAVNSGHHVLTPLYEAEDPRGNGRELPRPGRDETVQALTNLGISKERAHSLTRQSARRLSVMRRLLIEDTGGIPPEWASPQAYPWLPALVLIGQWDGNNAGDTAIISEITGQSYDKIERNIADLMLTSEPPFNKVGDLYRLICHEEAWHLLAPRLIPSEVKHFESIVAKVLGAESPEFETPAAGPYLASIQNKALAHSKTIRDGVARSLALLGTHPKRARNADAAAYLPARVVAAALSAGKGWQIWATLSPQLPALAEAAPEAFLEAVEQNLIKHHATSSNLFAPGDLLFSGTSHTGLLFALERLAWSDVHFSRVAMLLAQLAAIDPGGRISNRPAESLASIFRPWIRFSEASDDQRLECLRTLLARHPQTGWRTLVAVHPTIHDNVVGREPPYWRPWAQDGASNPTVMEHCAFIAATEKLLLENVGSDVARWLDLLPILPFLSADGRQRAITQLSQQIPAMRENPSSNEFRDKLRSELHRHHSYPDTYWALSAEDLEPLDAVYRELMPPDSARAYAWLFNSLRPDLPEDNHRSYHEEDNWAAYYLERVETERQTAVQSTYEIGGVNAIMEMTDTVHHPDILGYSIARSLEPGLALDLALQHAGSEHEKRRMLAKGILFATFGQSNWTTLDDVIKRCKVDSSNSAAVAEIYLAAPPNLEIWQHLTGEEPAVQTAYWQSLNTLRIPRDDGEAADYAIPQLLAVGRSLDAADWLPHNHSSDATVLAVLTALPRDLETADFSKEDANMLPYNINQLLEKLDLSEKVSDETIAALEIQLLGLMKERRHNMALHREVARRPDYFADLISMAYKRADGRDESVEDEQTREHRARFAFEILFDLRVPPGLTAEGTIDSETLSVWVGEAQRLCKERDREDIGNQQIGQMLANTPSGSDGVWPCEAVRDLLEQTRSHHIKLGIVVGTANLRGATMRGLFDGGQQERSLSDKYRADAQKITAKWPFTAQMLGEIASSYDEEAKWHDQRSAEFDEFSF